MLLLSLGDLTYFDSEIMFLNKVRDSYCPDTFVTLLFPIQLLYLIYPIKKSFGGKKLAPNGSRSGNVAPQMMADQEVGSPHLFLSVCLIAELKRGGRVFIR